jgi:hypothetical protein
MTKFHNLNNNLNNLNNNNNNNLNNNRIEAQPTPKSGLLTPT